jgi:hypothetical protein
MKFLEIDNATSEMLEVYQKLKDKKGVFKN